MMVALRSQYRDILAMPSSRRYRLIRRHTEYLRNLRNRKK